MLSDTKLRSLKPKDKPYRIFDERGLYVQVSTSGARLWRFKYKFEGKEKLLALGQYPDVPLSLARERRDEARQLLARNIDPALHKRSAKQGDGSFAAVFDEWLSKQKDVLAPSTWLNKRRCMDTYALPYIGNLPVGEVDALQVLQILRRMEARGLGDTVHRALQIIGQVMRYAVITRRATVDPTPSLRGVLKAVEVKHRAAILDKDMLATFLRAADAYPASPIVRAALLLQVLLFLRPGELRHLQWSYIDRERAVIRIPGEVMKMKDPHIVPLAWQSLHVLDGLQPVTGGSRFVLPSPRAIGGKSDRPMSENGVLVALRAMGYDKETVTGHGFRATARTFLDEELRIRPEVIEAQLAHSVRDPLGRAYNRTKYLEERTAMMQAWADWLWDLAGFTATPKA
jgi:integrase